MNNKKEWQKAPKIINVVINGVNKRKRSIQVLRRKRDIQGFQEQRLKKGLRRKRDVKGFEGINGPTGKNSMPWTRKNGKSEKMKKNYIEKWNSLHKQLKRERKKHGWV